PSRRSTGVPRRRRRRSPAPSSDVITCRPDARRGRDAHGPAYRQVSTWLSARAAARSGGGTRATSSADGETGWLDVTPAVIASAAPAGVPCRAILGLRRLALHPRFARIPHPCSDFVCAAQRPWTAGLVMRRASSISADRG